MTSPCTKPPLRQTIRWRITNIQDRSTGERLARLELEGRRENLSLLEVWRLRNEGTAMTLAAYVEDGRTRIEAGYYRQSDAARIIARAKELGFTEVAPEESSR